jgi:hypothetical protein
MPQENQQMLFGNKKSTVKYGKNWGKTERERKKIHENDTQALEVNTSFTL